MINLKDAALASDAWPFAEAKTLFGERLKGRVPEKGYVLFETGYGPSGLPHIGTFGEVVRTTMVRKAFQILYPEIKTRLFCFSDDMDGLRKVPTNIPNQDMVGKHLGKPLTSIPDPFGKYPSFGEHNNAQLRSFLDSFSFEYEFKSATECYKSGMFDQALLEVLRHYEDVKNVVLPTLRDERRKTYSPFLPVCQKTGRVLQVPVLEANPEKGTIVYEDEDGSKVETVVTGGRCKLQWKCDWAMRWKALDVNYEMSGKDLIESVRLSTQICKILGGVPPLNLTYELFLDEKGEKISKSRGNGLAVEEWLKYAPQESLAYFMYQKPKTAKRLYFDVIPKAVDDYLTGLVDYPMQEPREKLMNAVFHIHSGKPPASESSINYSLLLNLVGVCHSDKEDGIWHYIRSYSKGSISPEKAPFLASLVRYALVYYKDFVLPTLSYRKPEPEEKEHLKALKERLTKISKGAEPEDIQTVVYDIGKNSAYYKDLRSWFQALYQILLGQNQGPRMGSFIALYGIDETVRLIDQILEK